MSGFERAEAVARDKRLKFAARRDTEGKAALSAAERKRKERAINAAARSHLSKKHRAADEALRRERFERGDPYVLAYCMSLLAD